MRAHGNLINLAGRRFGRWFVVELHPKRVRYGESVFAFWCCRCDCGVERAVFGHSLRNGQSTSCGCSRQKPHFTKHGHCVNGIRTRAYRCWRHMMERCYNPNHVSYPYYGARGISVCERWHEFVNFLADMGEPAEGQSIDRVDVNGNYEPSNCRWATASEQRRNQRPPKRKRRRAKVEDIAAYAAALKRAVSGTPDKVEAGHGGAP
jgi:hypothetical protein